MTRAGRQSQTTARAHTEKQTNPRIKGQTFTTKMYRAPGQGSQGHQPRRHHKTATWHQSTVGRASGGGGGGGGGVCLSLSLSRLGSVSASQSHPPAHGLRRGRLPGGRNRPRARDGVPAAGPPPAEVSTNRPFPRLFRPSPSPRPRRSPRRRLPRAPPRERYDAAVTLTTRLLAWIWKTAGGDASIVAQYPASKGPYAVRE